MTAKYGPPESCTPEELDHLDLILTASGWEPIAGRVGSALRVAGGRLVRPEPGRRVLARRQYHVPNVA
jgi:hypothetical protein